MLESKDAVSPSSDCRSRDLRAALTRLNPQLPSVALEDAIGELTRHDFSRSLLQQNHQFHRFVRDGVPVSYRDTQGQLRHAQARENISKADRERVKLASRCLLKSVQIDRPAGTLDRQGANAGRSRGQDSRPPLRDAAESALDRR